MSRGPTRHRPTERDPLVVALTAERYGQNLTVRALAAKAGLSSSAISEWENGHHEPTLSNLRAWAAGLGLTPGLLDISFQPDGSQP